MLEEITAKSKSLKLGPYTDKDADLGPLTNKASLERINRILDTVEKEGGKIHLDGRNCPIPSGCEKGTWMAPTIITNLTTKMTAYKEEIFGPALCVMTADSLSEAMDIMNKYNISKF